MNNEWACSSGDKPYRQAAPVVHEHAQQLGLQLLKKKSHEILSADMKIAVH